MPVHSQKQFGEQRFNAIFNQDSFPEMPVESVRDYLRLAADRLHPGGLLFSINQEALILPQAVLGAPRLGRRGLPPGGVSSRGIPASPCQKSISSRWQLLPEPQTLPAISAPFCQRGR